jgi:LruC domain-containing protein
MKNKINLLFVSLIMLAAFSCKKATDIVATPTTPTVPTVSKIAPDGFTYLTTKNVTVNISTLTNANKAIGGVPVRVYSQVDGAIGQLLFKGFTNAQGVLSNVFAIPSYIDTVIVDPNFLGLVHNAKAYINGTNLTATLGGSQGYAGNVVGTLNENIVPPTSVGAVIKTGFGLNKAMDINGVKTDTKFSYLGSYDADGRPNYLTMPGDEISADMLLSINASLPETKQVPILHPEYIASGTTSNMMITEDAEVWLTFTFEGAGYKNSLGFYVYDTKNPPQTVADIKEIKFIFPNASLKGSGGSMISGDKVNIGKFPAGVSIGLVLFQNAWNGKETNTAATALFTNDNLNPEKTEDLRRHNVLLRYKDTFIIGFEDMRRDAGSDNDFNDLMIYATSNPITAISVDGVQQTEKPIDTDADGVLDILDDYPTDPERAYTNYYPSKDAWATLAFEDLFPNSGDYDLNDLVVSYQYIMVSNAKNQVVEMTANYKPIATGASYKNGFGVQFPFSTDLIKSVTAGKITAGYSKFNGNGTEAGQKNAVIIPFDDVTNMIQNSNAAYFVNTTMDLPKTTGETASLFISFVSPISTSTLGAAPFNPFLISNSRRGMEVHLPGTLPTDLADLTKLGINDDATNPAAGIYYVTKKNYPWALNFSGDFKYPIEQAAINTAYLHFFDWAASGGASYKDWYSNTGAGYRNSSNIYTK